MTDRLSLTNALADANIERQKAERIATQILDAIHDNVATKQDLHAVEGVLRADLQRVEAALNADLQRVQADLQRVESALRADMQALEQRTLLRLAELEHRLTVRFASVTVVLTGIVLAAIRYLPHS